MRENTGICLLNDSFPPLIDGVANAVVNYAQRLTERGDAVTVATPAVPGADDSTFPFQPRAGSSPATSIPQILENQGFGEFFLLT